MKTEETLFILTLVFGIIYLFAVVCKVDFPTISELFVTRKVIKKLEKSQSDLGMIAYIICMFIDYLGSLFIYFSLCYQVWFWLILKLEIIK